MSRRQLRFHPSTVQLRSRRDRRRGLVAATLLSARVCFNSFFVSKRLEEKRREYNGRRRREMKARRTKTPPLVPEDADPIWSRGTDKILSSSKGMKHRIGNVINKIYDQLGDPRIGPVLLLAALISFGSIWLRRSQSARPSEPNHSSQPDVKDDQRRKKISRPKSVSKKDLPPSITDEEPKDAVQAQFSDSDSE